MPKVKLSRYREDYYFFSGKTSDIVRQLAFAGIAVIWILRNEQQEHVFMPESLMLPALLLVITLGLDLLQYVLATAIWGGFQRYHESRLQNVQADPELQSPTYFVWPQLAFFWAKILTAIVGYACLITYMLDLC